jgi:hypothetical protein
MSIPTLPSQTLRSFLKNETTAAISPTRPDTPPAISTTPYPPCPHPSFVFTKTEASMPTGKPTRSGDNTETRFQRAQGRSSQDGSGAAGLSFFESISESIIFYGRFKLRPEGKPNDYRSRAVPLPRQLFVRHGRPFSIMNWARPVFPSPIALVLPPRSTRPTISPIPNPDKP